jgi:hypothetical protein
MAKKLLDGSDIVTVFQEMRREAVSHGMAARRFVNARFANRIFDSLL